MAKKGSIPWNKGLSKKTDPRVDKYAKTKSERQKGIPSKRLKYSKNPDDWFNICVGCSKIQKYSTRHGYANAMRRIEKTGEYKCCVCSANYQCSEKTIFKKNRTQYLKSLSEEERQREISIYKSERMREYYQNADPDELKVRQDNIALARKNMDENKKKEWYSKVSDKLIKRKLENAIPIFKPGYNKSTIPYIEDVLNIRYNTIFRHAESENGEFKIYDKDMQKFYYADAYSEELNIWVEFDENWHFDAGELKDECKTRESRIYELIPEIIILRISFDKFIYN